MTSRPRRARRPRPREFLRPPEVKKLLAAIRTPGASRNPERDYALFLLMAQHGLRVSEACKLHLSDLDLEQGRLHVERLKQRRKKKRAQEHPLFTEEREALDAWLAVRETMDCPCDALFISERRRPIARCTVWIMMQKFAEAAGLGALALHPHMLRHACGYDLANRGTDTRLIQDFLGHANIAHTVIYTRLDHSRFKGLF
jgi:site-specific recombinase XerD